MTSGVQAHGFSYSGVRPVIIAGHAPENLGFRTQFQLPVGTSTLGGRPGEFDKSLVTVVEPNEIRVSDLRTGKVDYRKASLSKNSHI